MKVKFGLFCATVLLIAYIYANYRKNSETTLLFFKIAFNFNNMLLKLDKFLYYWNIGGIQQYVENIFTYMLHHFDGTGLKVYEKILNGVEVIVFEPLKSEVNRSAIIYYHGGGFCLLSAQFYSNLTGELAQRLNAVVISVNYRKAPMHPFPAAFNDALSVSEYVFDHPEQFSIDSQRIILMGDSAGGNLAVTVGYELRNKSPKSIVALNPWLQMLDLDYPSMKEIDDAILNPYLLPYFACSYGMGIPGLLNDCEKIVQSNSHVNRDTLNKLYSNVNWTNYLTGVDYENREPSRFGVNPNKLVVEKMSQLVSDPRFSPLSALDDSMLRTLPSTIVFGGSKDVLRDEARLLITRLQKLKRSNPDYYHEIDWFHDPFTFLQMGVRESKEAFDTLIEVLQRRVNF